MSAPMRIFRFFRRIRPLLAYSPGYTFRSNLKRFITVGVIQLPVAIKLSCESKVKIEGCPQWISAEFDSAAVLQEVHIQFQGGFAGKDCWIEGQTDDMPEWFKVRDIYPTDTNNLQIFKLDPPSDKLKSLKIVFSNSTDFFGRITIYTLKLFGHTS